jgi:hypothetical protein
VRRRQFITLLGGTATEGEIEANFATSAQEGVTALFVVNSFLFYSLSDRLTALAAQHRIALSGELRVFVEFGSSNALRTPCVGKGNRLPAVTSRGISIVVPDLAISVGPTNHNPFRTYPSIGRRCCGKGEQHRA